MVLFHLVSLYKYKYGICASNARLQSIDIIQDNICVFSDPPPNVDGPIVLMLSLYCSVELLLLLGQVVVIRFVVCGLVLMLSGKTMMRPNF